MIASPTHSKIIDNFLVTLNLTDTSLQIEIEDQTTMKVFACEISPDNVVQLTEHLYQTISDCYTGLKEGVERQNDAKVSISQDAKLNFSASMKVTGVIRTREFQLRLQEVQFDRTAKLEREFTRLRKKVDPLAELLGIGNQNDLQRVGKLFTMMDDLKRSYQETKERDESLRQIAMANFEIERMKTKCMLETVYSLPLEYQTFNCVFDPNSAQKAQFDLSADNKRITKNANSNGSWYAMFAQNSLPSSGKHRISMKIEKYAGNLMAVGLAAGSLKASASCYFGSGAFSYEETNNRFFHNGTAVAIPPSLKMYEGDIIHFLVDLDREIIRVDVNDVTFCRIKVNLSTANNTGLYPCVYLGHQTSSVSFL